MPELQQQDTFQKRQIAHKVRISDILDGEFTKDESSAGYIKLNDISVSRVNVIATLVYKSENPSFASAVIDDGFGNISLRSFENTGAFSKTDIGEIVLVIGKIREFNSEKYIILEVLKKIKNPEWIKVRKLELGDNTSTNTGVASKNENSVEEPAEDFNEHIYSLIKKLDSGDGVPVDDVIKESDNKEAESIINKLLENGDIFEIKPGQLKVLE